MSGGGRAPLSTLNSCIPMRYLILLCSASLLLALPARAATSPDPILVQGLHAYVANGPEACLAIWYSTQPRLAAEMDKRLAVATKGLGAAFDTDVVAIQTVSRRVTRYYLAIYFDRRPLWVRIERYVGRDRVYYLPLKLSFDPDDILPGYLTDFVQ